MSEQTVDAESALQDDLAKAEKELADAQSRLRKARRDVKAAQDKVESLRTYAAELDRLKEQLAAATAVKPEQPKAGQEESDEPRTEQSSAQPEERREFNFGD